MEQGEYVISTVQLQPIVPGALHVMLGTSKIDVPAVKIGVMLEFFVRYEPYLGYFESMALLF